MGFFGGAESKSSLVNACFTSEKPTGLVIEQVLGMVQHTRKGVDGDCPEIIESVFAELLSVAKEKGANAVVNVKVTAGTYQQQASGMIKTYIVATGDAVRTA